MRVTPIEKYADCGDGYSVGLVQDETNARYLARIDLNDRDGTPQPRLFLSSEDRWVDIDAASLPAFVGSAAGSYASMPLATSRHLAPSSKETVCEDLSGAKTRSPWWYLIPSASAGLATLTNKLHFDTSRLPGFESDPMNFGLGVGTWILDATTTVSYSLIQEGVSDRTALVADLTYGGIGAGALYGVLFAGGRTPSLHLFDETVNNIIGARGLRHFGNLGGGLTFVGLGGTHLLLALTAFKERPTVGPNDPDNGMYVDPDSVRGHYDVSGNPYGEGTRFIGAKTLSLQTAANDGVIGAWLLYRHFLGGEAEHPPIRFAFIPDERGNVGGAVANLDLLSVPGIGPALRRFLGDPR